MTEGDGTWGAAVLGEPLLGEVVSSWGMLSAPSSFTSQRSERTIASGLASMPAPAAAGVTVTSH